MLYARPDLMHRILAINADAVAALPQRADRRRRAGGDGVRQLGRRARRRRLPGASAWPTRERVLQQLKRDADGRRVPQHRLHQGRRPVAGGDRARSAPTSSASTGRSTSARRGARVGAGVALQGNLDPNVLFAGPEAIRARGGDAARQLPRGAARRRATATSSTSATASASTRRRSMWRCSSMRSTRSRRHYHAARRNVTEVTIGRVRAESAVSEHSGLDLSP